MDHDSVDRIRNATFPVARKGYEREEVERFLAELADWLETGGGQIVDSDAVRRELERIGEQTSAILTEAHDAAQTIRAQADAETRRQLTDANLKVEALRASAEEYAEQTREQADAYARKTRSDADAHAERARIELDTESEEAREKAERTAKQIIEEANRRRGEVEKVISDLEERRSAVVDELRRLASDAAGAAGVAAGERQGVAPAPASAEASGAEEASDADSGADEEPTKVTQTVPEQR